MTSSLVSSYPAIQTCHYRIGAILRSHPETHRGRHSRRQAVGNPRNTEGTRCLHHVCQPSRRCSRVSILGCYRGSEYRNPRPRLRLEVVVVNDLKVQDTVAGICRMACTRHPAAVSSGSIFVMPLDEWVHIPAEQPQAVATSFETAHSVREAS